MKICGQILGIDCVLDWAHDGEHVPEGAARAPSVHQKLVAGMLDAMAAKATESVRAATLDGVRLGIGYSIRWVEAARESALATHADYSALRWLETVAETLRKASASDDVIKALEGFE